MTCPHERDVIDVNRVWEVWRGDRQFATRIGTLKTHDARHARALARERFGGSSLFVEEQRW